MDYLEPRAFGELWDALEHYGEDGRILAGGTALVLFMRQRLLAPSCLINLRRLGELNGIRDNENGLHIGPLATHAEAASSPRVLGLYPDLAETFRKVATPRIRNVATVGGNLVHGDPHLDPPVTLLALDTSVTLKSRTVTRQVPLTELFVDYYETSLGPGEVLTGVSVPPRPPRAGLGFIKFLPRSQDDYAVVDVAAWVRLNDDDMLEDVRLAFGSVGPVAFRATEAEKVLRGQRLSIEAVRAAGAAAASAADPEDDVRGSAAYKREMVKVVLGRALERAVADARTHTHAISNGRVP
jgi:aerobic carbon-monoxide dehydrogenase medium subunit